MPLWPDLNCHRDGRGHVLCNTLAASYDDYTSKTKGYGGTKGKGSETGCPLDFYGVGHVCVITTPEDPGVLFDEMAQVDYLTECPHGQNVPMYQTSKDKTSPGTKCIQRQNVSKYKMSQLVYIMFCGGVLMQKGGVLLIVVICSVYWMVYRLVKFEVWISLSFS